MLRFLRAGNKRTKTIWWAMIIVTVVTFLGGFVFLLGSGLSSGFTARATGAAGTVNGEAVSRADFTNALAEQRVNYKQQYGSDATDRELRQLEVQTWRSLVYQRLMAQQAKRLGLVATDPEVVFTLKNAPPAMLQSAPSFQTNGQFDYAKYQQALSDPKNDWAPFEELVRQQVPTRKLQERLIAAIKISEPEAVDAFHQRFDRVDATVVQIAADMGGESPKIGETELQKTFQKHQGRFVASARTELEVLPSPKKFGEAEVKTARDLAEGLVRRARGGEDFAALARDYSEGPAADQGGIVNRSFAPSDFGGELGAKLAVLPEGGIADPFQDQSRFVIIRRMPPDSTTQPGNLRIAQIVVRVRGNDEAMRAQYEELKKLRDVAKRDGLGKAATTKGLATFNTGPYDLSGTPQGLTSAPEVAEWGLNSKVREVSPVFETEDDFVVAQVVRKEVAGVAKRAEVEAPLRQLAEQEARVARAKPKADAVAQALRQGATLEAAATAAGLQPMPLSGVTRMQPDPRIANAPELIGALFGAHVGQVVGPIETMGGWFFARVDQVAMADTVLYLNMKTQLVSDLLQQRQRTVMGSYFAELREKSKIQNLRNEPGN